MNFRGMPSPGAASIVAGTVVFFDTWDCPTGFRFMFLLRFETLTKVFPYMLPAVLLVAALLMVSRFAYLASDQPVFPREKDVSQAGGVFPAGDAGGLGATDHRAAGDLPIRGVRAGGVDISRGAAQSPSGTPGGAAGGTGGGAGGGEEAMSGLPKGGNTSCRCCWSWDGGCGRR